jgi:hypothetical protein
VARTEEQIEKELIDSIGTTDGTLDTVQGPIPDVMIRPQAGRLSIASQEAESLRGLFSLDFQDSATDEEIENALKNFGSSPGVGEKARHVQYFLRFTRPTADIEIPPGTLVSNIDGNLTYQVVSGGSILISSMDSFFNPSRNAYEIGLVVEATGTGEEYNLPPLRVNTMVTPVNGIDSTENRVRSRGGLSAETKEQQADRLKQSLQGINLGAPGGIRTQIKNKLPELVADVAIIQPFEPEFARIVSGPALDVYCIGTKIETARDIYTAAGGETSLVLTKKPATNITALTVQGSSGVVDYSLVKDSTFETGNSIQAVESVVLSTPLTAGDTVVIDYEYNALLEDVLSEIFFDGEGFLFQTDVLLRLPMEIKPRIAGQIKTLPSFSATEVEQNVLDFLADIFNFTSFIDIVYPEVVRQRVANEVSGVQSFKLTAFYRSTGSLSDIEPLVFARNEISVFDTSLVDIKVVK